MIYEIEEMSLQDMKSIIFYSISFSLSLHLLIRFFYNDIYVKFVFTYNASFFANGGSIKYARLMQWTT